MEECPASELTKHVIVRSKLKNPMFVLPFQRSTPNQVAKESESLDKNRMPSLVQKRASSLLLNEFALFLF
ncbi:hypothetical protein [Priestia endophytica]|uniref:hypothetical protein n=1 Tax=Priestia endophytica TaxID=135735 RepID=UPI000F526099|nr:hypothetical protein [Priestia endophytica]RPK01517.1 hypothetical protein FH5_02358 [Priestia endophytica]